VQSNINSSNAAQLLGNPIWTFDSNVVPTANGVAGGVAVADNVAYFADGGLFGGGSINAVNLQTGAPIWRNGPPTPLAPSNPNYSFLQDPEFADGPLFVTTPVLTNDYLYIASSNGVETFPFVAKMHCLNRQTGQRVWSTLISPIITHEGRTYQPNDYTGDPTVVDDLVIVGFASSESTNHMLNLPNYIKDRQARGGVIAFDRFTGQVRWTHFNTSDQSSPNAEYGAGAGSWSSPAVDLNRNTLFIGSGQSFEFPASPLTNSLLAINYKNGKLKWHYQFTPNDIWNPYDEPYGLEFDVGAHPNLFTVNIPGRGNVDYVGVGDKRGVYYIFERDQNGNKPTIAAMITLDKGTYGGAIQSTATIDNTNGILYVVSQAVRGPNGDRVAMMEAAAMLGLQPFDLFFGVVDPKLTKIDLKQLLTHPEHANDAILASSENLPGLPLDDSGRADAPLTLVNDVLVLITDNGNVFLIRTSDLSIIAQTGPVLGGDFAHFPITNGGATIVGDILLVPMVSLGGVQGGVKAF
jgi:hypothetical protein